MKDASKNSPDTAPELKPKKARLKRKTPSLESCIRTDLLELAPNAGKAAALDHLIDAYQQASVEMLGLMWRAFQDVESIIAWKLVGPSNPLHGKSVTLQPAEAQAKGNLASHLGWIQNDVSKLIARMQSKLKSRAEKLHEPERTERKAWIDAFAHELRAINKQQAWRRKDEAQKYPVMKRAGAKLSAASKRAYESASKLFGIAIRHRSPPDLSNCQVEITRVESAYTSQECFACGHIHHQNRKGEDFKCVECGHTAHADENASECIGRRRPLPGSQLLSKTREGFSWTDQGALPWLPHEENSRLRAQGIRFTRLWAALAARYGKTRASQKLKQNKPMASTSVQSGRGSSGLGEKSSWNIRSSSPT